MSGLIYDEQSLMQDSIKKYDEFLHSRINKYTGSGRLLVTYYNINESNTSMSLGFDTHYNIIGKDSPLRFTKIINMELVAFSPLQPEEKQASTTNVRNYGLSGEAFIIPNTIMPKENDFFIVNHLQMNHLFRVTQVGQDGLTTDGSYKINYELFQSDPESIECLNKQVVKTCRMTFDTIGGEDLTPIIGEEEYSLRRRLISMVDDMVENYIARYYDKNHNCFILHLNGRSLFDVCGNYFMSKNNVMLNDNKTGNIVLEEDKLKDPRLDFLYQKSPYKWIERDAPLRYLDTFKFHILKGWDYPDSSFAMYGYDVDVMIPVDPWCTSDECEPFFPIEMVQILDNESDIRSCRAADCKCCNNKYNCCRHYKCQRYDYVSLIHDFIHGRLTSIQKLSLYTGDQLFDNADSQSVFLWSPIIIYIIKQVLKIK